MRARSSIRAVRKRSESTSAFLPGVRQQTLCLRLLEAVQPDDLVPRGVSGNEGDVGARHVERLGEEPQDRLVSAAVLGRLGDADLPRVTVTAGDPGTPGALRRVRPPAFSANRLS